MSNNFNSLSNHPLSRNPEYVRLTDERYRYYVPYRWYYHMLLLLKENHLARQYALCPSDVLFRDASSRMDNGPGVANHLDFQSQVTWSLRSPYTSPLRL